MGPTGYAGRSAQEATVLNVDLRDYFEAPRPGSYRIKAFFRVLGQARERRTRSSFP